MGLRQLLILIFLFCIGGFAGHAAEYVVAVNDPNADDMGPGNARRPWRTLSKAAATAGPGDTVIARGGTYREQVKFANSGKGPHAMIRLQAAPGEVVTISALDLVTGWEKISDGVYRKNGWDADTQVVLVDGKVPLRQIGPCHFSRQGHVKQVGEGPDDLFPGSFYCDTKAKALYIATPAGRPIEWHKIEAAVRDYCLIVGEWTRVSGIRCVGSNFTRFTTQPALICDSHSVIEDCEVTWADCYGFAINCEGVTVRRSRFNYCGGTGLMVQGTGHLLEDNVTNHNNWRQIDPGWGAGGIKNTHCLNVTVRRNVAAYNWGAGIWFDIDCRNTVIENSFCYCNEIGIHYEISYSGVIRNNVCVENSNRNIWSSTSTGVRIENNTCVGGLEGIVMTGDDRGKDYRLKDNIATGNLIAEVTECGLMLNPDGEFVSENRSDNNLFASYGGSAQFTRTWGSELFRGLEAWRAESGQDKHSIAAAPEFVDRRNLDLLPAWRYRSYGASPKVLRWVAEQFRLVR